MSKEYDVAISFAGADRNKARAIFKQCELLGLRAFYDNNEVDILVGKDLYQYLSDLYKNKATYCVILCSESYVNRRWTKLELRASQARAFEDLDEEYIIPVRVDDTEIPGIPFTIGHIDWAKGSAKTIADIILKKLIGNFESSPAAKELRQGIKDLSETISSICLTILMSDHSDIYFLFQRAAEKHSKLIHDFKLYSPHLDVTLVVSINKLLTNSKHLLERLMFVRKVLDPEDKKHIHVCEIPTKEIQQIYSVVRALKINRELHPSYNPENIINQWRNFYKRHDNYIAIEDIKYDWDGHSIPYFFDQFSIHLLSGKGGKGLELGMEAKIFKHT